jgi:competence protein ComEC
LIHLATAWLSGLFLGAASAFDSWSLAWLAIAAAAIAALLESIVQRERSRADRAAWCLSVAALVACGVLHARTEQRMGERCQRALQSLLADGGSVRGVFDDPVVARGSARGVAAADGEWTRCRVPLVLRLVRPAEASRSESFSTPTSGGAATVIASGGEWVDVRGRALATDRGLRVEGTLTQRPSRDIDWLRSVRARAGAVIDRDFGTNAPLVRALLIADQDGIDPAVRDRFADAGLVHMLSISGLHVAIIAGALLTLASAARLSRWAGFIAAMAVIVVYVAAIGAPAPAVRSAVMLGVVGLGERMQRPTHPWTALALGAVLPTIRADVVLDLGWQLSVSGMAALVAARAVLRRLRLADAAAHRGWRRRVIAIVRSIQGWRATLLRELITGTIATIVTAPIIAWTFGRVSIIAPLSNLAAGPLVAFIQPVLFLSVVLSRWPSASQVVAAASAPAIALLDRVAGIASALPYGSLSIAPTALGALFAGIASAAFVRATASRRWGRGLVVAAAALTAAVWLPHLGTGPGLLELHVLDVGQGDALALRTPRGRWVLMDGGRTWDGGDAGRRVVVPYVRRLGGDVAAFVLSHAHDDHVGGAESIVRALHPNLWWEPAFVTSSRAYRQALAAVQQQHVDWHRVRPGDQWLLDGVTIRVLAPDSAWTSAQENANETSVVLRISYGNVAFLLTGDAEEQEEEWLLTHVDHALLAADVLKAGHHGSRTSSTEPFLDVVAPRVAIASVGAGNRYGHPSPETLRHLAQRGVPLLRTDLDHTVVVRTDGRLIWIESGRTRWVVPRPGTN